MVRLSSGWGSWKGVPREGWRHPLSRAQQQAEDAGPPDVAVKPSLLTLKGVEDLGLPFSRMYLALAASEADDAGRAVQTATKGVATERVSDFPFPQVDSGRCDI